MLGPLEIVGGEGAFSQEGFALYVMNSDGADLTKVHEGPRGQFGMALTWTPHGERIVFWGSARGRETPLSIRPDGTGLRNFINELPPGARTLELDWSPDGRWIIAAGAWGRRPRSARPPSCT